MIRKNQGDVGFGFFGRGGPSLLVLVETPNPAAAAAAPAAAGMAWLGAKASWKPTVESADCTSSGVQWRAVPGHPVWGSM
jgi:hypothetical protein